MAFSAVSGALAFVKPTADFLLVPYFILRAYGISVRSVLRLCLYAIICLVPLYGWRVWIMQFPEGIPVIDWLLNKGISGLRGVVPVAFCQTVAELILGYWGLYLSAGVLVRSTKKKDGCFPLWGSEDYCTLQFLRPATYNMIIMKACASRS